MDDSRAPANSAALVTMIGGVSAYASDVFMMTMLDRKASVMISEKIRGSRKKLDPAEIGGIALLSWQDEQQTRSVLTQRGDGDNWVLVLAERENDALALTIGAYNHDAAQRIMHELKAVFSSGPESDEDEVEFGFWHMGERGAYCVPRKISTVRWDDVRDNYCDATRRHLGQLIALTPEQISARLLLWHGEAGTGKTYALRSLAWEWRQWCRFEYVIDPEVLFGRSEYLLNVLLADDDRNELGNQWRMLVLEDTGEMVSADAKQQVGQALSRLLNVSEGILGQGMRVMILITTNEEIGRLNPAATRPGRCLSKIQFQKLPRDDGREWLRRHGSDSNIDAALTLAELYARASGQAVREDSPIGFRQHRDTPALVNGALIQR
ncbi:MAG: DUF5925 domain-containing protein [Candidatus Binataceae bacterium]